jgi:hypothetical protein
LVAACTVPDAETEDSTTPRATGDVRGVAVATEAVVCNARYAAVPSPATRARRMMFVVRIAGAARRGSRPARSERVLMQSS